MKPLTTERLVRLFAGTLILVSLLLAHYHSHYWLWLAAFVGANLFQSALTRWCPAEKIFQALGVPGPCSAPNPPR